MYSMGKYVTGRIEGVVCAVCITEVIGHNSLKGLFSEIFSAGFFNVIEDAESPTGLSASCYGESVSLEIKSTPTADAILVGQALGLLPR